MMVEREYETRTLGAVVFPGRIAWSAVIAGSLVALAVGLVLAILALGLGLGAVDVVSGEDAESGAITGAVGVWWTVSAMLSLFVGGSRAGSPAARSCQGVSSSGSWSGRSSRWPPSIS
jgi:hypothetical protein